MSLAYLQPCKKTYYAVELPFINWQIHQENLKREKIFFNNKQKNKKVIRNPNGLRRKTKLTGKKSGRKKCDVIKNRKSKHSQSVLKQPTNVQIDKLANENANISSSAKKSFNENIFANMLKIKHDFSHKLSNEASKSSQNDVAPSSFENIAFHNEDGSNLIDIETKISRELIKNFVNTHDAYKKMTCSEKDHCIRILTEVFRICNALREMSWRLVMKWEKLKSLMLQHLKKRHEGKKRTFNSRWFVCLF